MILLGSSGFSAQLAGVLGLPFTFANHFDTGGTLEAVQMYQEAFRPSPALSEPYIIVSASVMAATNTEDAVKLAAPSRLRKYGMRSGRFWSLVPPDEALSHPEWSRAEAMPSNAINGTAEEVTKGLEQLAEQTQANELFLHCSSFGLAERLTSIDLIAEQWGLQTGRNSQVAAVPQ